MSRGSLIQLVAKGEMDKHLFSTDLEDSFFKKKVSRITNFSKSTISIQPSSSSNWGDTIVFKISRLGDLLHQVYLTLKLPDISVEDIIGRSENSRDTDYKVKWKDFIGNLLIEKIILRIGGQKIDEQLGEYIQFYTDIYDATWSKFCMLGHDNVFNLPSTKIDGQYIFIPLKFWFCNDYSNMLPLIALQYHEVEIEVKLRSWDDLYFVLKNVTDIKDGDDSETSKINFEHTSNKLSQKFFSDLRLDCNYIYLDQDERKEFAQSKHEFIITQTQHLKSVCKKNDSISLNFNLPIKEFFFVLQNQSIKSDGEIFNYSGKNKYIPVGTSEFSEYLWNQIPKKHILEEASLYINGVERIPFRDSNFWHFVQNYENYRNTLLHNIYMYSFGLDKSTVSGSCNFSRFDSVELKVKLINNTTEFIHYNDDSKTVDIGPGTNTSITVYANNYNVLVVQGGMGGLMFSS